MKILFRKVLQKYTFIGEAIMKILLKKYFLEKYCKNILFRKVLQKYTFISEAIMKILLKKVLQKYTFKKSIAKQYILLKKVLQNNIYFYW